jgi:hypothetical protein
LKLAQENVVSVKLEQSDFEFPNVNLAIKKQKRLPNAVEICMLSSIALFLEIPHSDQCTNSYQ